MEPSQIDPTSSDEAQFPEDWWTTQDVAAFLGLSTSTIRAYLARQQMPPPDRRMGRMTLWRPATITRWRD